MMNYNTYKIPEEKFKTFYKTFKLNNVGEVVKLRIRFIYKLNIVLVSMYNASLSEHYQVKLKM